MNHKSDFNKTLLPDSSFCSSWGEGRRGGSWDVTTGGIFFVSMAIPFLSCGVLRHSFASPEEGSSNTEVREAALSVRFSEHLEDEYAPTHTGAHREG